MQSFNVDQIVTFENFDEESYLKSNIDVVKAVNEGQFLSGYQHFKIYGHKENRFLRDSKLIQNAKENKLERIKPLIKKDLDFKYNGEFYDFLSPSLRNKYNIHDAGTVSSHGYDPYVQSLINEYKDGLLLDIGSGQRPVYYDNVVNLEIFAYDTTDVLSIGEILPFNDNSFDAIISIAVLEHVKDPFSCAREMIRVLKPGGKLFCTVPFLQPLHAYPNHYYNMTGQGLENLFNESLIIDKIEVPGSLLPIWTLTWFLKSWSEGLFGHAKENFLKMQVKDLIGDPISYINQDFVSHLSDKKNDELASGHALFAHKE